ncbi:hypothetical protein BaRGS_00019262, partial [Batillaria attramentaria]
MADSLKVIEEDYVKRIHSSRTSGHIHKGHGVAAANASIPTKYQTIVTDNADKRGFLAQAKRFNPNANLTDAPAPGEYLHHGNFDHMSPSYSKKGTGGFASKSKKGFRNAMSNAPGPGIYALPSLLTTRKDFNRTAVQSNFALPIAEHVAKPGNPGPAAYRPEKTKMGHANNVTAETAFKSKTRREVINVAEQSRIPAPGQYEIHDEVLHGNTKVPFSSFKSQTRRELMRKPEAVPGPGHYKPNEAVEPANRLLFPRKHYLCISAPAMALPQTPPLPGPGSYEVVNYEGPAKHYMSSAAFVSTT